MLRSVLRVALRESDCCVITIGPIIREVVSSSPGRPLLLLPSRFLVPPVERARRLGHRSNTLARVSLDAVDWASIYQKDV